MRFRAEPSDVVVNVLGLAALEYGDDGRYRPSFRYFGYILSTGP